MEAPPVRRVSLLRFPLLFYVLSIAYGSVPIDPPVRTPPPYYNVRYGLNCRPCHPTLATFKTLVSEGKVHYFIAGGGFGGGFAAFGGGFAAFGGGGSATPGRAAIGGGPQESRDSEAITSWVESHYTAKVVGGVTLYDLSPSSD